MTIRMATRDDANDIHTIYLPIVRDTTISFETKNPTVADVRRRISDALKTHPWLVYEQNGVVIGYAYAGLHRARSAYQWAVEVSAYVRDGYKKAGIGRQLYETLFNILAAQGYFNAYAGIVLPNAESVGFHTALGFQLIGVYYKIGYKHEQWHDVAWYERTLREHTDDPFPPVPLPSLPKLMIEKLIEQGASKT